MSTIHNPVNFKPEDYEVVDYIDNHPPQYFSGCPADMWAVWRRNIDRLNVQGGIHHCIHCGNGNVRYVAICLHIPSGRNVCFGSDCVNRLNFRGADEFKAAHIRTLAATRAESLKKHQLRLAFIRAHPELVPAFLAGQRYDNSFILDVASKLAQYGSLSERQIEAVVEAAARDAKRAAEKATETPAGPVPVGIRIEFSGVVLSVQQRDGQFGVQWKCLVKLDNGSKIWTTCPSMLFDVTGSQPKGYRVTFRATVEASRDDASFGFAKRPHLVAHSAPAN